MSYNYRPLYHDTDSVKMPSAEHLKSELNALYGIEVNGYWQPTILKENKNMNREYIVIHMSSNGKASIIFKDAIDAMASADYKERFKAEYFQLEIRINKLRRIVDNYEYLPFKPKCSRELLNSQLVAMLTYKCYLLERAKIEDIELFDINNVSRETLERK